MKSTVLTRAVLAVALAASGANIVTAAPAYSWNLSRAMMSSVITNPFNGGGRWSAMYDAVGSTLNPVNFQMMPTFTPNWSGQPQDAWIFPSSHALSVSVPTGPLPLGSNPVVPKGMPMLHPGPGKSSIVRWLSPLNGNVHVLARISDANAGCGNGITWNVLRNNVSLAGGALPNGHNGTVVHLQVPVTAQTAAHPGTAIYFVVSPNGNDH